MKFWTSNTVLGVIFAVVSWLLSPDVIGTIHNEVVAAVLQGIGYIWAAYGARKAIAKSALGIAK